MHPVMDLIKRKGGFKQKKTELKILIKKLIKPENDLYIPDPTINYNSHYATKAEHKRVSFDPFVKDVLPFLLKTYEKNNQDHCYESLNFLDIGCGLGPLAYALRHWFSVTNKEVSYTGLDIRSDAIEWLKKTYENDVNFEFLLHDSTSEADYIEALKKNTSTHASSNGNEGAYQLTKMYDIQWSGSVFTHMTPKTCFSALKSIADHSRRNAIQCNTWVIVDEMSRYAMSAKIADRDIPFDFGDYLSYSKTNPLICTAYKIDTINALYDACGLEILEILYGSWRGYTNNHIHSQDIIVSRKKQ